MRLVFEDPSDEVVRVPYEVAVVVLGEVIRDRYGPGVYGVTVAHDDDCPQLVGGECNCHYLLEMEVPG